MNAAAQRPGHDRIVYVVEDNADIGRLLCGTLDQYGFRSEHFTTAATFLRSLKRQPPALSVIDIGLPDQDGLQLVREVQSVSDSAILILTGRQNVGDRILGLELGADDYMTKPFEPREVVARANSILRRLARGRERKEDERTRARFGGWMFDANCNCLYAGDGREVELSIGEARLLAFMLRNPNRILNRAELMGDCDREPYDRSIDARISRLRRKLDSGGPEIVKTVYGAGYMLVAKVAWE